MPLGRSATPGQYADGRAVGHLLELGLSSVPGDRRILPRRRWGGVHAGAAAVRERGIAPLGYLSAPHYPSRWPGPFITASTKPLKLGLRSAMVVASNSLAISSEMRAV